MNKKLSVVISVLNQVPLASSCFREIFKNTVDITNTEFIIIDNGSSPRLEDKDFPGAIMVRNEKNIGVYPTFEQGFRVANGEVVVFLHSDLVIWENGWDLRVRKEFENRQRLGLVGFVGSDEIDWHGGRGGGTMSNFSGNTLRSTYVDKELKAENHLWKGSPASAHGKTITDYQRGAVVDGCVMIISRDAWNKIGFRSDFPPHHFYDRLISTQILEAGLEVGVLGIEFDHISGQTVNVEKGYQHMAYEWFHHNMIKDPIFDLSSFVVFDENHNYDSDIYKVAEDMWLKEYRDIKHIVPVKI